MFYKSKAILQETREWLWDSFVRFGYLKGMKSIREVIRPRLFNEAKQFMATCPYDTLTIALRRSHNDDRIYHMDCRASDTVTPEVDKELFSDLNFKDFK